MNSTEHMKKKEHCHISLNCLKPILKTIFKTAREKKYTLFTRQQRQCLWPSSHQKQCKPESRTS